MELNYLRNKKFIWAGKFIGFLSFFIIPLCLPVLFEWLLDWRVTERIMITRCADLVKELPEEQGAKVHANELGPAITEELKRQVENSGRLSSVFQFSDEFIRYDMVLNNRSSITLDIVSSSKKSVENYESKWGCMVEGRKVYIEPNSESVLLSGLNPKKDIEIISSTINACINNYEQSIKPGKNISIEKAQLKGCFDLTIKPDKSSYFIIYIIFFSAWVAVVYLLKNGPVKFLLKGFDFFKD